jgi:hypothetical protein
MTYIHIPYRKITKWGFLQRAGQKKNISFHHAKNNSVLCILILHTEPQQQHHVGMRLFRTMKNKISEGKT